MIISTELAKYIAEEINKPHRREARIDELHRYLMFNGKTQEIIKSAICKEFKKVETVNELIARIVPINIIQKIVTKLATIYTESPARIVKDRNERDQELLENYVDGMNFNQRQKEANRYFKLFKRNLQELYVDNMGTPCARNLPRHTYEVFSFSALTPNYPDVVCKIIQDDLNNDNQVLALWSDESHMIVNGKGQVDLNRMADMENPEMVNPFGTLPFVYINESSHSVDPISDDDLLKLSVTIPVILTDLLFACKYQCWSIVYTIGEVGDVPTNPNSVIPLQFGPNGERPEIGQIKPEVDIDKIVGLVTTILSMLLSTKNLKSSAISPKNIEQAASGISKMLDEAESIEDKKDQENYFLRAEDETWEKLSTKLIPIWRKQNLLAPEYNQEFSNAFEVSVIFRQPKVLTTEKELLENAKMRLDSGFSTLKRELQILYPNMTRQEIEDLAQEIREEKMGEAVGNQLAIEAPVSKEVVNEKTLDEDEADGMESDI